MFFSPVIFIIQKGVRIVSILSLLGIVLLTSKRRREE